MFLGRTIAGVGILTLMFGCQPPKPKQAPPTTAPVTVYSQDDSSERAAALARRTADYAEALKKSQDNAAPKPQPSDVKFVEPPPPPPPATAPVVVAPPPPATAPVHVEVAAAVPVRPAPKVVPPPVVVPVSTDGLDQQIAKRLKDNPLDVAAHLDQQLLALLRDQSVPDLAALSTLPSEDRETIAALMDCLANYRTGAQSGDNIVLTRKVRPLLDLADRIRTRADLAIPVVEFCSEVTAFGRYTPMPSAFTANHDHATIIYCEVENFSSRLDDQREWETRLTQSMQIYNDHGISVWSDPQHTVVDTARTKRHDFFLARKIRIPAALPAGRYSLKVTITDSQSQRLAEQTASMELTAE